jgi:hypothetical protein
VAALVWAANPALSDDQVERCIMSTGHTRSWDLASIVRRRIDALEAVRCALGETHPFLMIESPADGRTYSQGMESVWVQARADDIEDGTGLRILWSSSLEGFLGESAPGVGLNLGPGLRLGDHRITASATDSSGRTSSDSITIRIQDPPPVMTIDQPAPGQRFYLSQSIELRGRSWDPNAMPAAGPLPDSRVHWLRGTTLLRTGHAPAALAASSLGVGTHTLTFRGSDAAGSIGTSSVTIVVEADPVDPVPTVEILTPSSGTAYSFEGSPVRVFLTWSASDVPDGPIPFEELRWSIQRRLSATSWTPEQTLTVQQQRICVRFDPFGGCSLYATSYWVDLAPIDSSTRTTYRIWLRATDSGEGTGQDNTIIHIDQLI